MMATRSLPLTALAVALTSCVVSRPAPCKVDTDCDRYAKGGVRLVCDSGLCRQAGDFGAGNNDAGDGGTFDLPSSCMFSSECGGPKPICGTDHMCRPCNGGDTGMCAMGNVMTPRCDVAAGACVACTTATQGMDCATGTLPICNSDGSCRACQSHEECGSLVCLADGRCAPQGSVVYVNNTMCTGSAGTISNPYCDIQTALANLGSKTIIRVIGTGTPYSAVTFTGTGGNVAFVGPGAKASPLATISGLTNHGFTLSGSGTVTIDGFDITMVAATNKSGVNCSTSTTLALNLVRNSIHNNAGLGVDVFTCDATLDRNYFASNTGGGLVVTNSKYDVQNSIFYGNSATAVTINSGSSGVFRHNTLSGNGLTNTVGGIACNVAGMTPIENSIVYLNGKLVASQSQLSGGCTLTNVDIDETQPGTGNRNVAPDFTADYHLTGRTNANNQCCIDQILNSKTKHDIDGTTRPQGLSGKYDIGAHEVPQ